MKNGRRRRAPIGKNPGGPWYADFRERVRIERGLSMHPEPVRRDYVRSGPCKGLRYRTQVYVPGYGRRRLEVRFGRRGGEPRVYADGPTDSPHRYDGPRDDGRLCIWHPHAPESRRWVPADGFVALIGKAVRHLYCESYWRETDEWLIDEAGHDGDAVVPAPRWWRRAARR